MAVLLRDEAYVKDFTGREKEMEWLTESILRRHSFRPIIITGIGGIGKTSLIKHWLATRKYNSTPLWFDFNHYNNNGENNAINEIVRQIDGERNKEQYKDRYRDRLIVAIDSTDNWTERQYEEVASRILNFKAVEALVFIGRNAPLIDRSEQLKIAPLNQNESADLLRKFLSGNISETELSDAVTAAQGFPLALLLLSRLLEGKGAHSINSLLSKPLYELNNGILVPQNKLVTAVAPILVSATANIVVSLKKQPGDLRQLSSRDFEKLLAELLRDMGWEVELTKQTRDGGADILAYLNTDIGRLLCLVEAKHYREDRKIGVDLVRTLYGTLCDAQANSAMLVTSSSFTKDAREFQQKHQYQLTLKDYSDVVNWIFRYGNKV